VLNNMINSKEEEKKKVNFILFIFWIVVNVHS
jgi:hypothetical protein